MPFIAPAADSERAGLRGFLAQQLDGVRHTSYGLTEQQIRESPARSALTVGGLIKHITLVVSGWAARAEAAPGRPSFDPEVDGDVTDQGYGLTDDDTLETLLAAYDEAAARLLAVADTADLDALAPIPEAPWFPKDLEGWTVRWILLHVIEEVARHAGHADIIREHVDGATMYELMAGAEGWPATDWLTPWQPPADRP
jgi:uncharacterized damage-inducible protein DinB